MRLAALRATGLLDSDPERVFDRFTRLAATSLRASVALISLVDDHRQFFKSAVGLPERIASRRETPLTHSFCQHVVTTKEPGAGLGLGLAISAGIVSECGGTLVAANSPEGGARFTIDLAAAEEAAS